MAIQKEKQVRFLKQRSDLVIVQQTIESGSDLTIKKDAATFENVEVIELGEHLTLTENPDGSLLIEADESGVDFFTVDMDGLSSTYTANHNLGRFIAVARVYQPDGEVAQVEVKNIDNAGNVSENVAQVISSIPMLGTLTLI